MNSHLLSYTSWLHLFTYKRFHVLLNSLFKVLCNFPLRYLFAIGITKIFSLKRSLPLYLGCNFKQPDSFIIKTNRTNIEILLSALHRLWNITLVRGICNSILLTVICFNINAAPPKILKNNGPLLWTNPFSLAVTKGIPFGFFSSANLYA